MGKGLRESEAAKAALTFCLAVAKHLPLLDLSVDGATDYNQHGTGPLRIDLSVDMKPGNSV